MRDFLYQNMKKQEGKDMHKESKKRNGRENKDYNKSGGRPEIISDDEIKKNPIKGAK